MSDPSEKATQFRSKAGVEAQELAADTKKLAHCAGPGFGGKHALASRGPNRKARLDAAGEKLKDALDDLKHESGFVYVWWPKRQGYPPILPDCHRCRLEVLLATSPGSSRRGRWMKCAEWSCCLPNRGGAFVYGERRAASAAKS